MVIEWDFTVIEWDFKVTKWDFIVIWWHLIVTWWDFRVISWDFYGDFYGYADLSAEHVWLPEGTPKFFGKFFFKENYG